MYRGASSPHSQCADHEITLYLKTNAPFIIAISFDSRNFDSSVTDLSSLHEHLIQASLSSFNAASSLSLHHYCKTNPAYLEVEEAQKGGAPA